MKPCARETYGDDAAPARLLPEVRMVGWDRFRHATPASLAAHRHPLCYEVCYLADGQVNWWVEQETHTLRRGDCFVTRPGEWHGGVLSVMHPCELFWTQVVVDALPPALHVGLAGLPRRVFAGSEAVRSSLETLLTEHRAALPLSEPAARAALHALLVAVVRGAAHEPAPPCYSPAVSRALEHLAADFSAPLTVDAVACAVGLSAPRLVERFLAETSETPGEWRTRRRLQAAQTALRAPGASVTGVAFAHGFASSQYFATAFKRYFGVSPSQWQTTVTEPPAQQTPPRLS